MIKQLILLVHFFGIYFYHLFFIADVTAIQQFNSSIAPNSETTVTITINKGSVVGFAKVQQILPAGFSAEIINAAGASFTFKDQKMKLIWMALPGDKEFTISYKLIASANVTGTYKLAGRFSFIADNERQNVIIAPKTITITQSGENIASNNQNNTNNTDNTNNVNPTTTATIPTEKSTSPITINGTRTITPLEEGKFKIDIKINKTGVNGFAKITENIPTGFVATANETQGGIFSFKNNEVKILWMALPADDNFTVSYTLQAQEAINDSYAINGTISYLNNDVTKKYDLSSSTFTLNLANPAIADASTNNTDNTTNTTSSNNNTNDTQNNSSPNNITNNTTDNTANNTTDNNITSTPNPETGISYKVQIAALRAQKSTSFIAKALKVSKTISIEAQDGWSKYVVGLYTNYKTARDTRNNIRTRVKRAFVTAYNQGTRITVQEALMISNQKWYK